MTDDSNARDRFIDRWSEIIVNSAGEQCRGGAYSYPGALDRYERALGLKPAEAWLAKRLLSYDWTGKKYVFVSLRKISLEADCSYSALLKIMRSLELKGYVRDAGQHGTGGFNQVRNWSIDGLIRALERAILCDPTTEASEQFAEELGHDVTMADFWAYAGGEKAGQPYQPFEKFKTPAELNRYHAAMNKITGWDPFYGGSINIPEPQKREKKRMVCRECGKGFLSGSRNPETRCPKCAKRAKRQSLQTL
jgi:hypothetical protein